MFKGKIQLFFKIQNLLVGAQDGLAAFERSAFTPEREVIRRAAWVYGNI